MTENTASKKISAIQRWLRKPALFMAGIVFLVLMIFWGSCVDYVRPYEAGIKESRYTGGVSKEVIEGGQWVFTGPGVTIHRFPTAVQSLEMTNNSREASNSAQGVRRIKRIEIDTSDGGKVQVDVTVLFRITDPYAVMTKIGPKRLFEDAAVIPKAVLALKENLGQLLAEDFYHESHRIERCLSAQEQMNKLLKEVGIKVEHILVRQYYYEEGYQQQIENRKVQDQLVFTNRSMGEAAKEDAARRKIESEGEAAGAVERKRGEAEVIKIRAEAGLYRRKKESEGDMLVKVAEAKGTQLVNKAYASSGSDNLVALEMAKVLEGISLIVVSDDKSGVNPLDVNQMLRLVGAK
ncbi:MAG: SPFH domain-containing protein [Deltaproteobacteria bacterium]|nr:SPFH domain-containing protein [Deltaproteobacteria bacterium]